MASLNHVVIRPESYVAGTDLGEQAQRLGQARIDGGREESEGQEGGGHGGRAAQDEGASTSRKHALPSATSVSSLCLRPSTASM